MLSQYVPALVTILFGLAFSGLFLAGAALLGPKHTTAIKSAPFECGSDPIGSPRGRFSVRRRGRRRSTLACFSDDNTTDAARAFVSAGVEILSR